jgi:hypothetical protein
LNLKKYDGNGWTTIVDGTIEIEYILDVKSINRGNDKFIIVAYTTPSPNKYVKTLVSNDGVNFVEKTFSVITDTIYSNPVNIAISYSNTEFYCAMGYTISTPSPQAKVLVNKYVNNDWQSVQTYTICEDSSIVHDGVCVAYGENGRLFAAYIKYYFLMLRYIDNYGYSGTWSLNMQISDNNYYAEHRSFKINASGNNVCAVWTDRTLSDYGDVFYDCSNDGGCTFGKDLTVNRDYIERNQEGATQLCIFGSEFTLHGTNSTRLVCIHLKLR